MDSESSVVVLSEERVLGLCFDDVERHQYGLNRVAARRAAALADAVGFARAHPDVYALPGDSDAVGTAVRCAVMEAASRLRVSENTVRNLVFTADTARAKLPVLWARAWEGFATLTHLDAALSFLSRFEGQDAEALTVFDQALADLAVDCPPSLFRSKARRLADTLAPADLVAEHAAEHAHRRVSVEAGEARMSWVHLYIATVDAVAIKRRLTSTAKHLQKHARHDRARDGKVCDSGAQEGQACDGQARGGRARDGQARDGRAYDGRSRDQVRADLATAWLKGDATPTPVKTKVFVTVPADFLTPTARATVRRGLPVPAGAPDLNAGARLDTGDTVDRVTAVRLLLEAGTFTRVITDPVTGVLLDMDRKARTVTRQQREWLLLTHRTCTRDGCGHPAAESDIDHWDAFHGPHRGLTSIGNLHPFCAAENQAKEKTRFRYRRRDDSTVQLISPTGYTTRPPRPGEREAAALLERLRTETITIPEHPPF